MQLIKANLEQLADIMKVIEDGRQSLKELGLNQWQDGYPSIEDIQDDIVNDMSYVLIEDTSVIGTVALDDRGEKAYEKIFEGKWSMDEPYITVHRLAIARHASAKGIGSRLLHLIEQIASDKNMLQIRLDTHEDNLVMQRVAKKNNYTYAGKVNYGVDFDCLAYEKKIEASQ